MPVIKEINGIRVAFLAYTESINGSEKKVDAIAMRYGVHFMTHWLQSTRGAARHVAGGIIA